MFNGAEMHKLAKRLWPINRSLTGEGVRQTLQILKEYNCQMNISEVPSGTRCYDWTVPKEWRVKEAYIICPAGNKLCDFQVNNLHLVGYSRPFIGDLPLDKLQEHLFSLPEQPNAIPYVTSYYTDSWGFCISNAQRMNLIKGNYRVVVNTELFDGSLSYGEILIPGIKAQEIFISTYICHPSMANNEISGPVVATFLANWIRGLPKLRYSYRFVFVPETIGSIVYISKHMETLKKNVVAGFNVSCVGDDRAYSYLPSRKGNTISDVAAQHILKWTDKNFIRYSWAERGSDERQYCSPGVDLPIASIMRSKYGEYPEYHTSLDDLERVVTPSGLEGGFSVLKKTIESLESNYYLMATNICEPQLSIRGLSREVSARKNSSKNKLIMDVLTWADGNNSIFEIADNCQCPVWELYEIVDELLQKGLLKKIDGPLLN